VGFHECILFYFVYCREKILNRNQIRIIIIQQKHMHDIIYRTVQNYFHFFQPGDEEWGLNDFHLLELAFDLKLLDVNEVGEGLVDGVATLHVEDSRVKGDSVKNASTPDLKVFVVNLLVCREGVL